MRKLKSISFILLLSVIMTSGNVYAESNNVPHIDTLTSDEDYSEIISNQEFIQSEIPDIELNYEKGIKVYVDTNIVELNTSNVEEINDKLSTSNYVWVVPYTKNNTNGEVTIARGLPLNENAKDTLSPEEQQYINEREGKWTVTENSIGTVKPYYDSIIENISQLGDCKNIIVISSQPGIRMPIALALNNTDAICWISLGYQYPVLEELPSTLSANDNSIYDFTDVIEKAQKYDTSSAKSSGLGNATVTTSKVSYFKIVVTTLIVLIFAFSLLFIIKWKMKD